MGLSRAGERGKRIGVGLYGDLFEVNGSWEAKASWLMLRAMWKWLVNGLEGMSVTMGIWREGGRGMEGVETNGHAKAVAEPALVL